MHNFRDNEMKANGGFKQMSNCNKHIHIINISILAPFQKKKKNFNFKSFKTTLIE